MIFRSILCALCLLLGFVAKSAHAQTLSNIVDINFGDLVVGGPGDVAISSSSDTRAATGSVALIGGPLAIRGRVDVTYTPGAQVVISYPGSIPMTGPNSPSLLPEVEGGTVQTIPVSGVLTLNFGGVIIFTTSGATGALSATIPVAVDPL